MANPNDDVQNHSEDNERTAEMLYKALSSLDSHLPISTPSSDWFQQQIVIQQALSRRRLFRELLIFITVAVVLLFIFISVVLQQPVLFLAIQCISLVVAPIILILLRKKEVEA
jgi:hypothetical protein